MISRCPAFRFDGGDSDVRGFSGATGNVLIDGKRPTSKSESLEAILRRIPARSVVRIELIRAGAPGSTCRAGPDRQCRAGARDDDARPAGGGSRVPPRRRSPPRAWPARCRDDRATGCWSCRPRSAATIDDEKGAGSAPPGRARTGALQRDAVYREDKAARGRRGGGGLRTRPARRQAAAGRQLGEGREDPRRHPGDRARARPVVRNRGRARDMEEPSWAAASNAP
jgi:hypothetical protein